MRKVPTEKVKEALLLISCMMYSTHLFDVLEVILKQVAFSPYAN